jgi:integrase
VVVFKAITTRHIKPDFATVRSDRLRAEHIKAWEKAQSDLISSGKINQATYNRILGLLKAIVTWAREPAQRYLAHDPMLGFKHIRKVPKRQKAIVVMSPDEVATLIRSAAEPHDTILKVLAWTGCRIGEAFALQWQDIEWESRRLHVRRGIYRGHVSSPKTAESQRTVDVPKALLDDLNIHRTLHPPLDGDFIFRTEHGLPLDVDEWRKTTFRDAVWRAGLTGVTPHALRHSYASLMISKRLHLLYISRQLGHGSIQMTADVWTPSP